MSRLRTFRRNLDDEAVVRASKAVAKPTPDQRKQRIGHRRANKPKLKEKPVAIKFKADPAFTERLKVKRARVAKKPIRVKRLRGYREVDFKRKERRYRERHP